MIVLEAGNKIRILDWRKVEWLLTIYPGQGGCCGPSTGSVKDFFVVGGFLYTVGIGWWKKYDLSNISGGCGFTAPIAEFQFARGSNYSPFIATTSSSFIGMATSLSQYIHDSSKESDPTYVLNYKLPADDITAAAIRPQGDVLAIANGRLLTLVRNPNVEYSKTQTE